MRMQRTFQNEKYLWWSAMSILVQVSGKWQQSHDLLLSIAERQISDHYAQQRKAADLDGVVNGVSSKGGQQVEIAAQDKGKGKQADSAPAAQPASTSINSIEFDSTHEFFLVTRFLELRVEQAVSKAATLAVDGEATVAPSSPPSPSQLVLPSLPSCDASATPRETLLAHFASAEADKWCASGLGLEIWRREVELRHGSVEGGEWLRSWKRLRKSLDDG